MDLILQNIDYDTILPLWRDHLWVDRKDPIRPLSSMVMGGGVDMSIYEKYSPRFLGVFQQQQLVGGLSGHKTSHDTFRVRGLFIREQYRGLGGAHLLFKEFCDIAEQEGASVIWSYPKLSALPVYEKFGFRVHPSTESDEKHKYVIYDGF